MEYYEKVHINMTQRSIRVEYNRTQNLHMPFYHSHSDYELLYIRGGHAYVTSNTETVALDAPTLVLHQPYMLHRASSYGEEMYERYVVYFNKELAQRVRGWIPEFQKTFFGCMSYLTPGLDAIRRLDRNFEELRRCFEAGAYRRCEILLTLLLEDLITSVSPESVHTVLEKHSYISEVLVSIADNCEQELTVEGLAKQFFVSRAKLAGDFKDYTGMTVKQYILVTRINHAKHLLNAEGLTLSQVALRCGFCDDSHFINTFRRFEGITPKEYLAAERQSGAAETH